MNSNYELETPADALAYLHQMLDEHEALLPMIRGMVLEYKQYKPKREIPNTHKHDTIEAC